MCNLHLTLIARFTASLRISFLSKGFSVFNSSSKSLLIVRYAHVFSVMVAKSSLVLNSETVKTKFFVFFYGDFKTFR